MSALRKSDSVSWGDWAQTLALIFSIVSVSVTGIWQLAGMSHQIRSQTEALHQATGKVDAHDKWLVNHEGRIIRVEEKIGNPRNP